MKNKHTILVVIIAVFVGVIIGWGIKNKIGVPSGQQGAVGTATNPFPPLISKNISAINSAFSIGLKKDFGPQPTLHQRVSTESSPLKEFSDLFIASSGGTGTGSIDDIVYYGGYRCANGAVGYWWWNITTGTWDVVSTGIGSWVSGSGDCWATSAHMMLI